MDKISERERLIREVHILLGGSIQNLELDKDAYNLCLDIALDRYRQRSVNSTEERLAFLDMQPDQQTYFLPTEVVEVTNIYRRGVASTSGGGNFFEPFSAAMASSFVLLGGPSGSSGNLTTFECYSQFQNLVGTMFGQYITYFWHPTTHRLDLQQTITAPETVILHIYNYRPEELLLNDTYARPWLRSRTMAEAMLILGGVRGKYGSFAGPQGGITLNGPALISQATALIEKLDKEIDDGVDANIGYSFVHG